MENTIMIVVLVLVSVYILYVDIYKGMVKEFIEQRRKRIKEIQDAQRAEFYYYKMRHNDFEDYDTYEDYCKSLR
jgi:hypothetical protein